MAGKEKSGPAVFFVKIIWIFIGLYIDKSVIDDIIQSNI